MPKIDPFTGCSVLTLPEFLADEAAREGKKPHEILDEMYAEQDAEERKAEREWKEDLPRTFAFLKECIGDDVDPSPSDPVPFQLLEVLDAKVSYGARKSEVQLLARVLCNDCQVHVARFGESNWYGGTYDPPDYDCFCEWSDDTGGSVPKPVLHI